MDSRRITASHSADHPGAETDTAVTPWIANTVLSMLTVLVATGAFFFMTTRGTLLVRGLLPGKRSPADHVYPIYSNMRLIRMVDFQPIIAAILLFQYDRLVSIIVNGLHLSDLRGKRALITSCAFGNVMPRVSHAARAAGANEVQVVFTNPATIINQVKAGRIRALAYNSARRASFLPDVPTMNEAGVKGMEMDPGWYGVFAPAATAAPIVSKLHAEVRRVLAQPQVIEKLAGLGVEPVADSPREFRQFVLGAIKRAAELTRIAGIEPE